MYQQIECLNAPVINISRLGKEMAEFGSGFLEKKSFFFILESEMVTFQIYCYTQTQRPSMPTMCFIF